MEFLSPEVLFFFLFVFSTLPTTDVNVIFEVQLDLGFNNAQFWMHNEMCFFSILKNLLLSPHCQFSGFVGFFFLVGWVCFSVCGSLFVRVFCLFLFFNRSIANPF